MVESKANVASKFILILSSVDSKDTAHHLAQLLVEKRLAACVQVLPEMISIYRWAGRVQKSGEFKLLIKTVASHAEAIKAFMATHHPYNVPECLILPIHCGSEDYLAWLKEQTL